MSKMPNTVIRMMSLMTVTIALFLCETIVPAQNLVQNAAFDFDSSLWSHEDESTVEFDHRSDVGSTLDGGSGPGSLEVRHYYWSGGSDGPFQEIFGITEGKAYTVAASYYLPSENNVAVSADLFVRWLDGDGFSISHDWVSNIPTEYDTWVRLSGTVIAPGGAVSCNIRLMVDNPSDDDETRPGVALWDDIWLSEEGADEAVQVLWVPAAASVAGLGGTFWSTTGWFSNAIDYPVTLWGTFLPSGQDNSNRVSDLTELATIQARGFIKLEDMVQELGESDASGGLYLEARASAVGLPAVLVTGTTHTFTANPTGDGLYGQGLPAVGPGILNRAVIPGLFKNQDQRTNIGVLNTSGQNLVINVEIWDDAGNNLKVVTWTLPPYSQRQNSLSSMGIGTLDGGTVVITRQSSSGSFRAYTSTVDQHSGDAVYNPGL